MGVRDKLRHALNLHDTTPEGFKYQRVGEEIKITGFRPKLPITEIPADIDGLPVGIISGLQSIPFMGEMIIPNTVHMPHSVSVKHWRKLFFQREWILSKLLKPWLMDVQS